eukprot:SAG31_NODE_3366_length_4358_cov_2.048133_2_plen_110_part_00
MAQHRAVQAGRAAKAVSSYHRELAVRVWNEGRVCDRRGRGLCSDRDGTRGTAALAGPYMLNLVQTMIGTKFSIIGSNRHTKFIIYLVYLNCYPVSLHVLSTCTQPGCFP